TVERDFALSVDLPQDHVRPQQFPDPTYVPGLGLPGRRVTTPRVLELGISPKPRRPAARRIQLPLPAVQHFQPRLQLGRRGAALRLSPRLANPLVAFHHPAVLGVTRSVEYHAHPQTRQ